MSEKTKEKKLLKVYAGILIVSIFLALILLPKLFSNKTDLDTLSFQIQQQYEQNGNIVLIGTFDKEIEQDNELWLYIQHAQVKIDINERSYLLNELPKQKGFMKSPGSGWFSIDSILPDDTITFTIHSYYGDNQEATNVLLDHLYSGTIRDLYKTVFSGIDFWDFVIIASLISGLLYIIEGSVNILTGLYKDGVRILLFGFYCFAGSLWCIPDVFYPYLTLFITPTWMVTFLDWLGLLLFPIALTSMVRYFMIHRYTKKIMSISIVLEVLLMMGCLFLQWMGLHDLYEVKIFTGSIVLIILAISVICVFFELYKQRKKYLVLLISTILPVFISASLGILDMMYAFTPNHILMQYGFPLSVLFLLLQLVSYAKMEKAKKERLIQIEKELVDLNINVMMSQIQPHFLYNSLLGIKQLCDSNPKKASDALEHFSYYLRGNLDSLMDTKLIPFQKELDHLHNYLYLEKMRFSTKLQIQMNITYLHFQLPPLTIQPLVENAIRYGIMKKKGGGTILIHCERQDDRIHILIQDDGIGFDQTKDMEDGRTHVGIKNVQHRLQMLCEATLQIESKQGVGTRINIYIPVKENSI